MALADIDAGRGIMLIDPKGDLVTDLLARLSRPCSRPLDWAHLAHHDRGLGRPPLGVRDANHLGQHVVEAVQAAVGEARVITFIPKRCHHREQTVRRNLCRQRGQRTSAACDPWAASVAVGRGRDAAATHLL